MKVLLSLLLALMVVAPAVATEPVEIYKDETEVLFEAPLDLEVELPATPEGHEAVVEFTAWYRSPVPAGFYGTMYLYWDEEELLHLLDRPDTFFHEGLQRDVPMRRIGSGWLVAILPEPEAITNDSNYSVPTDEFNLTRYRFRLPQPTQGNHRFKIVNKMQNVNGDRFERLAVRDIVVRFEKP